MNRRNLLLGIVLPLLLGMSCVSCKKDPDPKSSSGSTSSTASPETGINKVNHVVVIYLENHSFDNLYGEFPGANGIANASAASLNQLDIITGQPYKFLPVNTTLAMSGPALPLTLPNGMLFNIDLFAPQDILIPDVTHRFYQEQMQIDGGKMDYYAAYNAADNSSAGLSQGYYKTEYLPLKDTAMKYTLCDNFFHSAFGGSFLNHQWLIAAASPTFPNAPASMVAKPNFSGGLDVAAGGTSSLFGLAGDGAVTPDGFVVNTSYTVNMPHPASTAPEKLVPNQKNVTIGDRLTAKNISWAWYSGGWNDALAGNPAPNFQFHHQPFAYYANYADGTQAKADHLKDEKDFFTAAKTGNLPAVSFVKPLGDDNEHPGYATLAQGEKHTIDLIHSIMSGPNAKDVVIIVTYDENGGFWDHVAPPVIDNWGPGTRVPAIIISPFAKKGKVDNTQYETVSILSFIEKRWGLDALSDRDKKANPLTNAFDF